MEVYVSPTDGNPYLGTRSLMDDKSASATMCILAGLLLGACIPTLHLPADGDASGHLTAGDQAFAAGNVAGAIRIWNVVLDEAGESNGAVRLLARLADAEEVLGRYGAAETYARRCRERSVAAGWPSWSLRCALTLGKIQRRRGNYDSALAVLAPAHDAARRGVDAGLRSDAARNLGAVYQDLRQSDRALELYRTALETARKAGLRRQTIKALNNIGGVHRLAGRYREALAVLQEAVALDESSSDVLDRARLLGNLCQVYVNLSQLDEATRRCRAAARLARRSGAAPIHARILNDHAVIYERRGNLLIAKWYYHRSYSLSERTGDVPGTITALNNLGELQAQRGRCDDAVGLLNRAMTLASGSGQEVFLGSLRGNLGLCFFRRSDYDRALEHYSAALVAQQRQNNPEQLWRTYANLSLTLQGKQNRSAAIVFGKKAVAIIQGLRRNVSGIDPDTAKAYLRHKTEVYRHLADMLIKQERILEAQLVLEMLKDEEYRYFLRGEEARGPESAIGLDTVERNAANPLEQDLERLGQYSRQVSELRRAKRERGGLDAQDQAALDAAIEWLGTSNERVADEVTALAAALAGAGRGRLVADLDLERLDIIKRNIAKAQDRAVLIYYVLLDEHLRILVHTPTSHATRQIAIPRQALTELIVQFWRSVRDRQSDPLPLARRLNEVLIDPVAGFLTAYRAQTLVLWLDGILRYIPFAALHDGDSYLVEKYAVARFTAAAKSALGDAQPLSWRVAGLGVTKSLRGFDPLPAVKRELDGIVLEEGREDSEGSVPGKIYLDEQFTADALRDALVLGYRVIHISSHFVLQPATFEESFLVLGDGQTLRLVDFRSERYLLRDVDLMTLSACNTGLDQRAAGTEIEGFGSLVHRRGVKAVVATLWKVQDQSTARFMREMYQLRRQGGGATLAEAIRSVQMRFINPTGTAAAPAGVYTHPYYWAPFVLMGNWI